MEKKEKVAKPAPVHAKGQSWKHKRSGAVITLGHCIKATAIYANGTRLMRVSTLVRDYDKIK